MCNHILMLVLCVPSHLAQLYLLGILLQYVRPRPQHRWLEHRLVWNDAACAGYWSSRCYVQVVYV